MRNRSDIKRGALFPRRAADADEDVHNSPPTKRSKTATDIPKNLQSAVSPAPMQLPSWAHATPSTGDAVQPVPGNGVGGKATSAKQVATDGEEVPAEKETTDAEEEMPYKEAMDGEDATAEQEAEDWEEEQEEMHEEEEQTVATEELAAKGGQVVATEQQLTTANQVPTINPVTTVGHVAQTALPPQLDYRLRLEVARLNARHQRLQMALRTMQVVLSTVSSDK